MKRRRQREENRCVYRRRFWVAEQIRIFQTKAGARRFAKKVQRPWRDLEPVFNLHIERRSVGPWHVEQTIARSSRRAS
jgi:hypothetical protein